MKVAGRTMTRTGAVLLCLLVAGTAAAFVADGVVAGIGAGCALVIAIAIVADGLVQGAGHTDLGTEAGRLQEWHRRIEDDDIARARLRFGGRGRGVADDPVGISDAELWRRERERRRRTTF